MAGCLLTLVEGSNFVKPKGPERVLNTLFVFLHDVQEHCVVIKIEKKCPLSHCVE